MSGLQASSQPTNAQLCGLILQDSAGLWQAGGTSPVPLSFKASNSGFQASAQTFPLVLRPLLAAPASGSTPPGPRQFGSDPTANALTAC